MSQQSSGQEKTEKATPRKRKEGRKKGQVAKSQDLNSAFNLLGVISLIFILQSYIIRSIYEYLVSFFSTNLTLEVNPGNIIDLFYSGFKTYLYIVGPMFMAAIVIGLISNLGQVGFLFSAEIIKPKLDKINPINGFKKIFSLKSLVELIKSILKICLVGLGVYLVVYNSFRDLIFSIDMEPLQIYTMVSKLILKVALTASIIFIIIAIFDYLYQRYEHEKNLKMTKQELKDEFKQSEGDPFIKGKRRQKQREMTMNRMIQAIPDATVVITNPTHLSIAIKYKAGEFDTPVVVAKGAGVIALKIRELAKEHNIPIIENKPVAQMLYKNADIGDEIPVEIYQAIAEILAMVYKIKGKL